MRIRFVSSLLPALALLLGFAYPAAAQRPIARQPRVTAPKSSLDRPASMGRLAHTNILIVGSGPIGAAGQAVAQAGGPPFSGYFYETPASLACIYHLVYAPVPGCNPNVVDTNPYGGSRAIGIVDAYDNPNAVSDLDNFIAQFALAPARFHVVFANGTNPGLDPSGGWELEESLDVEYAHAMAPDAEIFLVEAASESIPDLITAENVAARLVARAGGGEVTNSWGYSEFSQQTELDSAFVKPNVVFFASAGDSPGTLWPSVSPNVVSVGGTSTNRDPYLGNFLYEGAWNEGGGGPSEYEARPRYQNGIASIAGPSRVTPDISADANPITGVWVLNTNLYEGEPGGWFIVGGTSVSSPVMAGIVNAASTFRKSSAEELSVIYTYGFFAGYNDLTADNCGPYGGYFTTRGYDLCTGVGSPQGYFSK
jgi:kumamolisin